MKSREPASSLELLLDAMCNTFGGVMFIAISLVVVMSMLSPFSRRLPDPETLKETLAKQERELQILRRAAAEQPPELEENDPRLKLAAEWARLREEGTLLKAEQSKLQSRIAEADKVLRAERTGSELQKKELQKLQSARDALTQPLREARSRLQTLKAELAVVRTAPPLRFRIQEKSLQKPYFYILHGNRAWQVGPDDEGTPSDDCTSSKSAPQPDGTVLVRCRAIPERGVDICNSEGALSEDFLRKLNQIPEDRVPFFQLDQTSLKSFCILRNYLKERGRLHGVSPVILKPEEFNYRETDRQTEYYY